MLRATLKSLLSRKVRLLLSALAVVLGVMFVSGAFVLTDTLGRSFSQLFATAYSTFDVQVAGAAKGGRTPDGSPLRDPVPASTVDRVAGVPGVAKAQGSVFVDGARAVDRRTGKVVSTGFSPRFGANWVDGEYQLRSGQPPRAPDEVAINGTLAQAGDFAVGDPIAVLTIFGQKQQYRVSGIFGYVGGRDSLAGETTVAFTTPVAQRVLLGRPDVYNAVDVTVAKGESPRVVRDRLRAALGPGYDVQTSAALARQMSDETKRNLRFFTYVLWGFAGVALFVGVFLILNTFSIIVAQRMRELALMRALGATRRQVVASVLAEAALVGLIASVVGFALGVVVGGLFATLLGRAFGALGVDGVGVPWTAPVAAFSTGVLVTLVAALVPALRAAQVAPMAAMRESATPDRPLTRLTVAGAVVLAASVVLLGSGLAGSGGGRTLWTILAGVLAAFVGVALLTPIVARPAVSALGRGLAWSMPGELGRRNSARNPRRTAVTAGALMVSVALVTAVGTVFSSAKVSVGRAVNSGLRAQLIIAGEQSGPTAPTFDPRVVTQVRQLPGVERTAALYTDYARVGGGQVYLFGVDDLPALAQIFDLRSRSGGFAPLRSGQLVVDERTARDARLRVGSTVPLQLSRGQPGTFTVVGVYRSTSLLQGYVLSGSDTGQFLRPNPVQAYVQVRPDASVRQVRADIDRLLADSPEVTVSDRSSFVAQQTKIFDTVLSMIQILLALAMLIAVLGVVNTLALSVLERTRELGMLRAVGMHRSQTTWMITVEAVVISVFGGVLGVVVGLALGTAAARALRGQGITALAWPWTQMVVYLAAAAVVGVVAAVIPAVRAARLDVLAAIAQE